MLGITRTNDKTYTKNGVGVLFIPICATKKTDG